MNEVFGIDLFGVHVPDTVLVTIALTAILTAALALAASRLQTHGLTRWQTALEVYVRWIERMLADIFGHDPTPYVPLIGSLIGFIALSNLLSIVPVIRPPTADLSTAVALALVVFFAVPWFGIRRHGLRGYLRVYLRPHPLLAPLNVLGEITRTLALAVRLFGNVMSGHMIGAILLVVAGVLVPIPILMLGVLTGLIQAYIFGVLAAVYIAAAVEADVHPDPEVHHG